MNYLIIVLYIILLTERINLQHANSKEPAKFIEPWSLDSRSTIDHDDPEHEMTKIEFNIIREERDRYRNEKEQLIKELNCTREELHAKKQELNDTNRLLDQERKKISRKDTEIQILEEQYSKMKDLAATIMNRSKEVERQELEGIKAKLTEFEAKEVEAANKYALLERQNKGLMKTLDEFEDASKKLQGDVEQYKQQIAILERKVLETQANFANLKARGDKKLEDELEQTKHANFKTYKTLQERTEELAKAKEMVKELQTNLKSLQRRNDSQGLRSEIKTLEDANLKLTEGIKDKEHKMLEARKQALKLQSTIEELNATIANLMTRRDRRKEDEDTINRLKSTLEERESLFSELNQKVKELTNSLAVLKRKEREISAEFQTARQENESLSKSHERLAQKFNAQTEELWRANEKAAQTTRLEKEVRELKFQLEHNEIALSGLKKKFTPEYEEIHGGLVKANESLAKTNEKLNKELKTTRELLKQLETEFKEGETRIKRDMCSFKYQRNLSGFFLFALMIFIAAIGSIFAMNEEWCIKKC